MNAFKIPAKRSKYGAMRTTVDGLTFASKKEAQRYRELRLLEKAGEIESLFLQPRYELHAAISEAVIGFYVADFTYWDRRLKREVVEDVKSPGTRTALYKWKRKHVETQYGITIMEI